MKASFFILLFINFNSVVWGQNTSFEDLQTPVSPGFILLDQTPSAIERPATPQGLGISMLNLFSGGALEVAPFWLKNHPNLTAEDMMKTKVPFLHSSSISLSTVNNDSIKYVATGFRTRLYQKYSGKQLTVESAIRNRIDSALSVPIDSLDLELIDQLAKMYGQVVSKPILFFEFAMAMAIDQKSLQRDRYNFDRTGAWLSLHYRPGGKNIYGTLVGRYIFNGAFQKYQSNSHLGDAGIRLNYEYKKLLISGELLCRTNLSLPNSLTTRYAFIAAYELFPDIQLTASVGKNYENLNTLFTMIGLDFGYSKKKIKTTN